MPTIPQELVDQAKMVEGRFDSAEPRHKKHRTAWETYYAQYRSYRDLKAQHGRARTPNDVDSVLAQAKSTFDEQLFIPYALATIETVLPRMLSRPPKIGVRAKRPEWEDNTRALAVHIDTQQDEADYELCLQDTAKSGLMYGLGVQKLTQQTETRKTKVLAPPTTPTADGPKWVVQDTTETIYSGPVAECIDVFDWIWDPLAYSMRTLSWCIHRTWRDDKYLKQMFETKGAGGKTAWQLPDGWDLADAIKLASGDRHSEIWKERDAAAGRDTTSREASIHEVWEYHDGEQVILVLDRTLVVAAGENPYWHGQIPFQIYRPTRVPHEMVGIGEIEAITALIDEMNTLRTQRRDNAALVLQRPFAYFEGMVDPGDIAFGPGIGIPVEGDPREIIMPFPVQDIPASGYQEEANLTRDIERVTGLDDSLSGASGGGGGASETATGVQLVQAAANVRIANKTKLLARELVRSASRQWFRLNQQFVTEETQVIGPPMPGEDDRDFSYYAIGPAQYAGDYLVQPDDGSMEPENLPVKRQNAQAMMMTFGENPAVDQRKLIEWALGESGVENPAGWLMPEIPQVPLHALDQVRAALEELAQVDGEALLGILTDPRQFDQLVQGAVAALEEPAEDAPAPGQQSQQAPPVS